MRSFTQHSYSYDKVFLIEMMDCLYNTCINIDMIFYNRQIKYTENEIIWLEICETCSQLPHFISIGLGWCFCQFSILSLENSLSTQLTDPACERTANER